MADPNRERRERSRIADNRLAAAVVVASLLGTVVAVSLYRVGLLEYVVPERGPPVDAAPLYLLIGVFAVVLLVWGWGRLLSWFE